jgi:hypothetical protein
MFESLHNLSPAVLNALAKSLKDGPLALGVTSHGLKQVVGAPAGDVYTCIDQLRQRGMTPTQIGLLVEAVASTRANIATPQHIVDLVISGPEVAGVPTADTAATVQTLIENAQTEILLVGYAVQTPHSPARLCADLPVSS